MVRISLSWDSCRETCLVLLTWLLFRCDMNKQFEKTIQLREMGLLRRMFAVSWTESNGNDDIHRRANSRGKIMCRIRTRQAEYMKNWNI